MPFEDIMMKIANNKALTQSEKEELRLQSKNISNVVELSKTWQRVGENKINPSYIDFPINTIYSKLVERDMDYLEIEIPSIYNHMLIMGSGKTTGAGLGIFKIQFNGDTGTNYSTQLMQRSGTTQSGDQNLSIDHLPLGYALETADGSIASVFFSIINHYTSSFYKASLSIGNYRNASFRYALQRNSFWDSTEPIRKMKVYTDDQIKTGTLISIYGLV